jgi:hypothetical protein
MTSADWGRLPGEPSREEVLFSCPDGHTTEWAVRAPRCPKCGQKMKPTHDDPYAERRRKIREERDKE